MNIIVLSRKNGRPVTVNLTPRVLASLLFALVLSSAAVGGLAYWAFDSLRNNGNASVLVGQDATDQLKAMSARMVEMQARLIRLDALGEHLAESAQLDSEEFDFKKKPPMGGPLTTEYSVLSGQADVMLRLQELTAEIELKEDQLEALDGLMSGRRVQPRNYLANMPVRTEGVHMSSNYGYRSDPFSGRATFHGGIDFAGPAGTKIMAVAPGIVTKSGPHTGYGNMIEISHGDNMVTRYAHASRLLVKVGDLIAKDQAIALMGSTGRSTGSHLHYEVLKNGQQVDPASYIAHAQR